MRASIENLKNGWYDLSIGLKREDIKKLIELLNSLLNGEEGQHFHLGSDYNSGEGGVGDIEIYLDEDNAPHSLSFTGFAIPPNH